MASVDAHQLLKVQKTYLQEDRMGKAKRIIDGKRNANVPVDMSDKFYDEGNEYCRYLITDPRSDRLERKRKPFEKRV